MTPELMQRILAFREERDWRQFHTPRTLAASIAIEAGELLELLQWSSDVSMAADVAARRTDLARELADVLIYSLLLAHDTGIDLDAAIAAKLDENAAKYPVEKSRGRSTKYTDLD